MEILWLRRSSCDWSSVGAPADTERMSNEKRDRHAAHSAATDDLQTEERVGGRKDFESSHDQKQGSSREQQLINGPSTQIIKGIVITRSLDHAPLLNVHLVCLLQECLDHCDSGVDHIATSSSILLPKWVARSEQNNQSSDQQKR